MKSYSYCYPTGITTVIPYFAFLDGNEGDDTKSFRLSTSPRSEEQTHNKTWVAPIAPSARALPLAVGPRASLLALVAQDDEELDEVINFTGFDPLPLPPSNLALGANHAQNNSVLALSEHERGLPSSSLAGGWNPLTGSSSNGALFGLSVAGAPHATRAAVGAETASDTNLRNHFYGFTTQLHPNFQAAGSRAENAGAVAAPVDARGVGVDARRVGGPQSYPRAAQFPQYHPASGSKQDPGERQTSQVVSNGQYAVPRSGGELRYSAPAYNPPNSNPASTVNATAPDPSEWRRDVGPLTHTFSSEFERDRDHERGFDPSFDSGSFRSGPDELGGYIWSGPARPPIATNSNLGFPSVGPNLGLPHFFQAGHAPQGSQFGPFGARAVAQARPRAVGPASNSNNDLDRLTLQALSAYQQVSQIGRGLGGWGGERDSAQTYSYFGQQGGSFANLTPMGLSGEGQSVDYASRREGFHNHAPGEPKRTGGVDKSAFVYSKEERGHALPAPHEPQQVNYHSSNALPINMGAPPSHQGSSSFGPPRDIPRRDGTEPSSFLYRERAGPPLMDAAQLESDDGHGELHGSHAFGWENFPARQQPPGHVSVKPFSGSWRQGYHSMYQYSGAGPNRSEEYPNAHFQPAPFPHMQQPRWSDSNQGERGPGQVLSTSLC